jgi:O-antigen/teichoic acid export membrane protein
MEKAEISKVSSLSRIFTFYKRSEHYIKNSYWIIGEKVASMGLTFVATVFIARYLSAEDFGSLAYAFSMVSLFGAAGHMGLSGLVVREIVKDTQDRAETLGTVAVLKLMGMGMGYGLLLLYATIYEGLGSTEFYLLALAGLSLLFQPLNVIIFWFQAFVQAKYIAMANISTQIATTGYNLFLVFIGSSVLYFSTSQLFQAGLLATLLLIIYRAKADVSVTSWKFSGFRARELLGQGWVIYLGSIFAITYLKADQVMLRWLVGTDEVAQYAIAARLSEIWYFIPSTIVVSVFPRLIKLRESNREIFDRRLQQLFDILFMLGLTVAIIVSIAGPWLISLFFGMAYKASASILVVHIWAGVFIFMRAAFSKWILIESALLFSLITQGAGALTNILLNFALIPSYGGIGAAYATLISYATSSFFALALYQRTRPIFWQMTWAMLSPFRYLLLLVRIR